jgi:regulator of sigma E protease
MLEMCLSILAVALALYLTVFIHEWSHYLLARKFGIPTRGLNIGLGPVLLAHKGKLDINLRLMPIGGYLDIPDMTFFKPTGLGRRQRCIIAMAGPMGNLVFCFYLAAMLTFLGIPIYGNGLTIGFVGDTTLNIKPGDRVVLVDGQKPRNWSHITGMTFGTSKTNITMVVLRDGSLITNEVPILLPGLITPKIQLSPALRLLRRPAPFVNQKILSINGSKYFNGDTFVVACRSNHTLHVTFQQEHQEITEDWKITEPLIYSLWEYDPPVIYANPLMIMGGTTWQICKSMWEIVCPRTNLRVTNLSGPLTTMLYMHRFFVTDVRLGLFLTMALNLNLLLFNLLPIYPMDSSHVLLAFLEKTRYVNLMKSCMYFATWAVILLLAFMLSLDVLKFSIL